MENKYISGLKEKMSGVGDYVGRNVKGILTGALIVGYSFLNFALPNNVDAAKVPIGFDMIQFGDKKYVTLDAKLGSFDCRFTDIPGIANKVSLPIEIKKSDNYEIFAGPSVRQHSNTISPDDVGGKVFPNVLSPGVEVGGRVEKSVGKVDFKAELLGGVEYTSNGLSGSEINVGGSIGTDDIKYFPDGISAVAQSYFDLRTGAKEHRIGVKVGINDKTTIGGAVSFTNYSGGKGMEPAVLLSIEAKANLLEGVKKLSSKLGLW